MTVEKNDYQNWWFHRPSSAIPRAQKADTYGTSCSRTSKTHGKTIDTQKVPQISAPSIPAWDHLENYTPRVGSKIPQCRSFTFPRTISRQEKNTPSYPRTQEPPSNRPSLLAFPENRQLNKADIGCYVHWISESSDQLCFELVWTQL
jgi:hypothetical protein